MSADELNRAQWERLERLFERASELPPGDRHRFIESEAGDDPLVARRLRSMMESAEGADERLASTLLDAVRGLPDPRAGQSVGPYRLVEVIGHGGMGTVYLAERADELFDKQVAIKIIRTHLADSHFARRFLQERQILAGLEHPNIARLIDGGSTGDGLPYLVLEYVDGDPLDVYCDRRRLSVDQRLALFRRVLDAAAYAHRHLVVHRDLKPSNVLVTADGMPKLLDFGIAKLLSPEERVPAAPETLPGLRSLTPEYASPEQVRGQTVTTATDVYALGLILYELLAGHRPYRVDSTSPAELARTICELEPKSPSSLLGDPAASERAAEAAAARGTSREGLIRRLRGDLDNIVMMALRKEPERRYTSLDEMARDIDRHREGMPVSARPNTFTYRAGKFLNRHRAAAAAVIVAASGLVAATIISLNFAAREARQRALAEQRFEDVRELATTFIYDVHDTVATEGATAAMDLLVATGTRFLDALDAGDLEDPTLAREVAHAYARLAGIQADPTYASRGDVEAGAENARRALAMAEALLADAPDDPMVLLTAAKANRSMAAIRLHRDEFAASAAHFEAALRLRRLADEQSEDLALRSPRRDMLHAAYGHALANVGRYGDAVEHYRAAIAQLEELVGRHPERRDLADQALVHRAFLGEVHQRMGEFDEARSQLQPLSVEIQRELEQRPANSQLVTALRTARGNLGRAYNALGDTERAETELLASLELVERTLLSDPTNINARYNVAATHHFLGEVYDNSGRTEQALEQYRKMLALARRSAEDSPSSLNYRRHYAIALDMTGFALRKLGRKDEALERHREANNIFESIAAARPDDIEARRSVAVSWYFLGQLERDIAVADGQADTSRMDHLENAVRAFEAAREIMIAIREAGELPPGDAGVIDMLEGEAGKTRALQEEAT